MSVYYPINLDLRGRRVVVVGGGTVAQHKIRELVRATARVTVITPEASPGLDQLADEGGVEILWRPYRRGDLQLASLAIAATSDRAVNHEVFVEAQARGIPVNAVDDLPNCTFIAPAIHRQGDLTITVSTSGHAPAFAARLRDRIASWIGPEYGGLVALLGRLRAHIALHEPDFPARRKLWYDVVDADVLDHLRRGDEAAAESLARDVIAGAAGAAGAALRGKVYLVGAGPGDPGLITVRGREALGRADVVVYDRLVPPSLLELAPAQAERVFVGKGPAGHSAEQGQINTLLISRARQGRRVVRLKGGDPFVFGRGGEECEALAEAGVACEVIPGVTSAVGVPAAAGIPLTHRHLSSGFAVVAGHECDGGSDLDWSALARMPTLVVLMGLRTLVDVVSQLYLGGAPLDRPAAVIADGTLPTQRVVTGTLENIVERVAAHGLEPPATLVVGEVVRLHRAAAAAETPAAEVAA
jgi:uroporphyrin-III C-methyltransferase/precorrin-2 dehydrogenase/sirohydrochlorin ferrochelatase